MRISYHLLIAFLVRLAFIAYGEYHDSTVLVKYTDVDYRVFTDAARFVVKGESPYNRYTYRYTPILAWILTPNITLHPCYGKVLFSLFDVFVGYMIYLLISMDYPQQKRENTAQRCSYLWLYNPLPITVATRGNAESVVAALVLAALFLFKTRVFILTGIVYGLAVHFKIYPITYCLPMYLALSSKSAMKGIFEFNIARLRLIFSSVFTLVFLTGFCYWKYGHVFLQEGYLHHITRRDTRHNFSVYFYLLYLTSGWQAPLLSFITFLPQVTLIVAFSLQYGNMTDLSFCMFCHSFIFVTFNKVCTSQYFLWYLSLLPVCLPDISLSLLEGFSLLVIWFFAQGSWLLPAFYLEYEGKNTFVYIWLESIAFFCANIGILAKLSRKYKVHSFRVIAREETLREEINKID